MCIINAHVPPGCDIKHLSHAQYIIPATCGALTVVIAHTRQCYVVVNDSTLFGKASCRYSCTLVQSNANSVSIISGDVMLYCGRKMNSRGPFTLTLSNSTFVIFNGA